jgi:hypothetical protein
MFVVCAFASVAACVNTSAERPEQNQSALLGIGDACGTSGQCGPGLLCTLGICCDGTCGNLVCALAGACDDGNPCTTGDACSGGSCVTTPVSNGTSCGSGLVCDQSTCVTACWIDNKRVDAGVGDTCKQCNPSHSTTSWTITVDAGCSDGNACTLTDRCNAAGLCVSGSVISCPTADACHSASTCDHQTGACGGDMVLADGTSCEGNNLCLNGSCTRGCFIDGGVVFSGITNPGNSCEVCDPDIDSTHWAPLNGIDCDDGDLCTLETCVAGACMRLTSVKCAAIDSCHDVGECEPATGICTNPISNAGKRCNDGFACSTDDACNAGQCVGDTSSCECDDDTDCPPSPACHKSPKCRSHVCTYDVDNNLGCSDQDACTLGDHCSGGQCVTVSDVQCHDQAVCGRSVCDVSSGQCVMKHAADGDACDGGSCVDGACFANSEDAGTSDAGVSDAGIDSPDGGPFELPPVNFVAEGCSSAGAGFSLVALALMALRRRRRF